MAISLYDATVLGFMQTMQAMEGVLQRGLGKRDYLGRIRLKEPA